MAFAVLGFAELIHVRNLHSNKISCFKTSLFANKALIGAIVLSAAFMVLILLIPPLMNIFGIVAMDKIHWIYVLLLSLTPIAVVELMKLFKINSSKDEY